MNSRADRVHAVYLAITLRSTPIYLKTVTGYTAAVLSVNKKRYALEMRSKYISYMLGVQLVLSQMSIVRDASSLSDHVVAYLISSLGSIVLAFSLLKINKRTLKARMVAGAFLLFTVASIALLAILSLISVVPGSVGQAALLYVNFLWMYLMVMPLGAFLGMLYHRYLSSSSDKQA